jgi:hypothetical protein
VAKRSVLQNVPLMKVYFRLREWTKKLGRL